MAYDGYVTHKQTYKELAKKYKKTEKTIRKYFDKLAGATGEISVRNLLIILILDATFFGRGYGILLVRSPKKVLHWHEIESESVFEYEKCLYQLECMGYRFSGFVIDGRPGVRQLLTKKYPGIPIQICQFHPIQIIKRYIPTKAKTDAARELRKITMNITKSNMKVLEAELTTWYSKYSSFLMEKTLDGAGKWRYTHHRIRSAYRSLKTNLPFLFTFKDNFMPNTTNHCDGLFAHLKQKILIHRGISRKRRKMMIDYFLENY